MVSQKARTKVEIAGFTIIHTFLIGKMYSNCTLRSNFLVKMATEVDFKVKEIYLHQGDKTSTASV